MDHEVEGGFSIDRFLPPPCASRLNWLEPLRGRAHGGSSARMMPAVRPPECMADALPTLLASMIRALSASSLRLTRRWLAPLPGRKP
jgi:hypothetical protein